MISAAENAELDLIYAAWCRLGVNFTGESSAQPVDLEHLILATARVVRIDGRLTICAASWLACYHSFVDHRRLSELTRVAESTVLPYLGALLSLAVEAPDGAGKAPQFEAALARCKPIRPMRALYDIVETIPTMKAWMQTRALPLYQRWGFWHDDATLKKASIHSPPWVLKVPELQERAQYGASAYQPVIHKKHNR
jgi:hypothetical protein